MYDMVEYMKFILLHIAAYSVMAGAAHHLESAVVAKIFVFLYEPSKHQTLHPEI